MALSQAQQHQQAIAGYDKVIKAKSSFDSIRVAQLFKQLIYE